MKGEAHFRARIAVAALVLVQPIGACSSPPDFEYAGERISNAEQAIADADGKFERFVSRESVTNGLTIAEDSLCFFQRNSSGNLADTIFCGPTRMLGRPLELAWLPLDFEMETNDDAVTIDVAEYFGELTQVDVTTLVRPDGSEPAKADSVDEPKAPPSPHTDFAVMTGHEAAWADARLTPLDDPWTIVSPAATLRVEASGDLEHVSAETLALLSGQEVTGPSADLPAPFYRPAEGQEIRAWQISVSDPPVLGPSDSSFFVDEAARDASLSLAVKAGTQRLNIVGGPRRDTGSAGIDCPEVPCEWSANERYILLTSTAEGSDPALVATTDGFDQQVSLRDGSYEANVSDVAQTRTTFSQQISTAWGTKRIIVATQDTLERDNPGRYYWGDATYSYGGQVQRVYLTPFDYAKGWAPLGKAWLVIPIENDPQDATGESHYFIDWARTWTLNVGETSLENVENAGPSHSAVFEVDDDFTVGEFRYQPVGKMTVGDAVYEIVGSEALTLQIEFPKESP